MTIQDFKELISILSPIILAVLGYFFNRRLNKQKKDLAARDELRKEEIEKRDEENDKKAKLREEKLQTLVLNKLEDLEVSVTDMSISFKAHLEDTDFRMEFKDQIRNKSRQILIHLAEFLEPEQKNILSHWADLIEYFGLDFFYTSKRKRKVKPANGELNRLTTKQHKKELDKYLTQELDKHITNFYNYIDSIYEEMRMHNGKPVFFSQFVDDVKLHVRSTQLKMRCVANGFTDNAEIIDEFSGYIEDFFADFVSAIRTWNLLEIYQTPKYHESANQ